MDQKPSQESPVDAAYIRKEKFYIALFFIAILIVALLAIGIMAYMTFYSHPK